MVVVFAVHPMRVLVCWAKGQRVINRLPNLSLITTRTHIGRVYRRTYTTPGGIETRITSNTFGGGRPPFLRREHGDSLLHDLTSDSHSQHPPREPTRRIRYCCCCISGLRALYVNLLGWGRGDNTSTAGMYRSHTATMYSTLAAWPFGHHTVLGGTRSYRGAAVAD